MSALHYTLASREQASTVLFLHGFMGSSADWAPVIAALEEDARCLAVDLPGHGASVKLQEPAAYSMEGTAEALCEVLDELGVSQSAVVGYSMGGRVALYFAMAHPERCSKLVLESASPGLKSAVDRRTRRGVDEARAVRLESEDFGDFLDEWYRQPLFETLGRHPGLIEQMIETRRQNDPIELARSLRGMGTGQQPSLWERLPELDIPTLAIAGALDGKYVEIAERMAVLIPRARTAIIQNAGHNVHAEFPKAYQDLLTEFLYHP